MSQEGCQGVSRVVLGTSGLCVCGEGECVIPCVVWKGFPAFPAHLRMRPVSRGNSRRASSSFGGLTWELGHLHHFCELFKTEKKSPTSGLSGCEGKLGVALDSLQGRRDLT